MFLDTLFMLVYDRDPSKLLSYMPVKLDTVDQALINCDSILTIAKTGLLKAQQRMKLQYDKGHQGLSFAPFAPGDWVWLRIHPHHQLSIIRQTHKRSPKFFRPFQIKEAIGPAASCILPNTSSNEQNS
ncbi:unnamed protein product [Cuscuta epithymum]|uniref:Tf2-1-like SH3-like domain-containing protein n=1 Tax=Cuscuta epithymum TaxID=186058 RepID=A0AAV0FDR3_9ASTE|nr:unnamed protein product [Cuscuta epithymum]